MKMIYLCAVQYRNWKREVVQFIHSRPFETQAEAELALPEICEKHRGMGWIIEAPCPPFVPPLRAVRDGEPLPGLRVIGLDENGNQVT